MNIAPGSTGIETGFPEEEGADDEDELLRLVSEDTDGPDEDELGEYDRLYPGSTRHHHEGGIIS